MKPKLLLLDADGLLWNGEDPIPGVREVLEEIVKRNIPKVIVTNNPIKDPSTYPKKGNTLYEQQIFSPDEVVTPLDVVGPFFDARREEQGTSFNNRVMKWGGSVPLQRRLEGAGMKIIEDPKYTGWVVVSETHHEADMDMSKIMNVVNAVEAYGASIVATNSDIHDVSGHDEDGTKLYKPVTGSAIGILRGDMRKSRKIYWLGKEAEGIYKVIFERFGIDESQRHLVLALGDRLDTDIYGGNNVGIATGLVATPFGINQKNDIARHMGNAIIRGKYMLGKEVNELRSKTDRENEVKKYMPTFVFPDLRAILSKSFERYAYK